MFYLNLYLSTGCVGEEEEELLLPTIILSNTPSLMWSDMVTAIVLWPEIQILAPWKLISWMTKNVIV